MKFGVWEEDVVEEGDTVFIFDINFAPDELLCWYDKAESIELFDHHEHAYNLKNMPFPVTIDNDECGMSLAYKRFFPEYLHPRIVNYVKDRDLWQWKMPESRAVSAYISSFPFDFHVWEEIEYKLDYEFHTVVREGNAILRYTDRIVDELCAMGSEDRLFGYDVPVVNSPVLQSEIGNRLLDYYPDAPFSAVYHVLKNGNKKFSLRSADDRLDVGRIAKELGGGGHRNAAGLVI